MSKGKIGQATSGVQYSPAATKRIRRKARREDRRWAARSGPVTVTYKCICPAIPCKLCGTQ